ncbi:MAG TPA: cobalt ECF transporter T component CbiQ [Clostridia bacterium]|nr:cobalt ECF transporter T component CbiQ [Clostridia bacterium]
MKVSTVVQNATVKTVLCILAAVLLTVPDSAIVLGVGVAVVLTASLLIKGCFKAFLDRLRFAIPFLVFGGLGILASRPGMPVFTVSIPGMRSFSVTVEGLWSAAVVEMKSLGALAAVNLLIATTPLPDVWDALVSIGLPAVFVNIADLASRYFNTVGDEATRMLRALESRAFRPCRLLRWADLKIYGSGLGLLFIKSLDRAERVYNAMLSRGFSVHDRPRGKRKLRNSLARPQQAGFEEASASSGKLRNALPPGRSRPQTTLSDNGSRMAIRITDLHFTYPDGNVALRGVTLAIPVGARAALLGANGAGKSTLLLHTNGLYVPQKGSVRILDTLVADNTKHVVRSLVGLVFQDPDDQVFSATVWRDVAFGPTNQGLAPEEVSRRVDTALAATETVHLSTRRPHRISLGEKKRVAIAGVLAMQPEILVLDEPTAFLDPRSRTAVMSVVTLFNERGKTVVIATHDVDLAFEWATHVFILEKGVVVAWGGPEILLQRELMYDVGLEIPKMATAAIQQYWAPEGVNSRVPFSEAF